MVGQRDPQRQPHRAAAFGDNVAGYANYGRNRARSLYYDGEIYELYLRPEFQGLGFGRKLFTAARRDLAQSGLQSLVVWALSDNEPAVGFYRALGGKAVARSSERFGSTRARQGRLRLEWLTDPVVWVDAARAKMRDNIARGIARTGWANPS